MRRVPTNSFHADIGRIVGAFIRPGKSDVASFETAFAHYAGVRRAFLVGSGTSALYVILRALKGLSGKSEVVLPAYMVPTLTLAIARAGLVTKLCEIDRSTFNMDATRLKDATSPRTLAVVPAHLFGFPMALGPIRESARGGSFFVVEDAAQAPGATLHGRPVGGLGDVGFFSLCKGKIISAFRGGVITTDNDDIARAIERELGPIRPPGRSFDLRLLVTLLLLAAAVRPAVYGALLGVIGRFKSTTVHTHFEPAGATDFIARLGLDQLGAIGGQVAARVKNGRMLLSGLGGIDGIITPKVVDGAVPAFNHLPVVVKNKDAIGRLRALLLARGIDTARMYERPVHRVYDLGYGTHADPFPEATYVAERLVVVPTHPLVTQADVRTIIETFRETV